MIAYSCLGVIFKIWHEVLTTETLLCLLRLRSLLLDFCIDFVSNSFLTAFLILSVSITPEEGSYTFIQARHKEVVRSEQALSHVL